MGRKILIQAFVFSTFIYGCADHTETTVVYTPCELSSEISTTHHVSQMHDGDYHERGPFVPWNSNPSEECPSNPTIRSGEFSGKELYITYPAVDEPLETGVVTVPQGKLPVVVFTHANNFYCTAFELYKNLHNHWASWGFVVVSVDSTDANCRRTSKENLELRSDAQIAALQEVLSWTDDGFQGLTIDEDFVFFSGHSRGGGATLNLLGGDVESDGLDAEVVKTYRPDENPTSGRFSRASALRLRTESEGRYTTHMPEPLLIDSDWTLNARLKLGNESGLKKLGLTIVTTEGEIQLDALEFIGPMPLSKWYTQLHVPLEEFVQEETEIVALRFDVEAGEVFVDDLRFTPAESLDGETIE